MDFQQEEFARAVARELARELRADPPIPVEFLSPKEAAVYLGVRPRSLEAWRADGRGPRYHKVTQRIVRYALEDLRAFVKEGGTE